jgi:hypothetical protein
MIKSEFKGMTIHMKDRTINVDDIKSASEAKKLGLEHILEVKEKKSKKKAAPEADEDSKGE